MKMRMKKIDVIVLIAVILVATLFFYKAGYIPPSPSPTSQPSLTTPQIENKTVKKIPTPPPSFILPSRKAITSDDEGCHFKSLLVNREWWYFSAIFDSENSELKNWGIVVSFKHLAYGDLFGELKPDVLTVVLFDDKGNVYGGVINEKRGTLDATSPGVDLKFKNSWAQGEYPRWHLHAETRDVGDNHRVVIDLDYEAHSLPIWIYDMRFNNSKSKLASYAILGCNVSGEITIDGRTYKVKGTGFQEHSWSPIYVRKSSIGGWDWIQLKLDNGWIIYISKFYPSSKLLSKMDPFGKLIITPDGESITEFRTFCLDAKSKEKIFLFTKFPARFSLSAKKTHNILLERIDLKLNLEIETTSTFQKVWKFPTYVGFKMGGCKATGTISWLEDGEEKSLDLSGVGTIWTTRLL